MSGSEAGRARREQEIAAPSPRSGTGCGDGTSEWDEWYGRQMLDAGEAWNAGRLYGYLGGQMRRAFLAGWSGRDAVARREAADGLARLTEELGLYGDGGNHG